MPRWASRITLEVTGVRVERVQDISTLDCGKEGVLQCGCEQPMEDQHNEYFCSFKTLWDSIYSKKGFGWDVNPGCWCIEFKHLIKE